MTKALGYILDDAPSTINGARVITILLPPKNNRKIGDMWQTFHLLADEVQCPYQTRGVQCAACNLCAGGARKAKSVAVLAH